MSVAATIGDRAVRACAPIIENKVAVNLGVMQDLAPTPVDAIAGMIDGLRNVPPGWVVDMGFYGAYRNATLFGNASTFAVMQLGNVRFTSETVGSVESRARILWVHRSDLAQFETAINQFRLGDERGLALYYKTTLPPVARFFQLGSFDWQQQLKLVDFYLDRLMDMGLER